jgi:putative FmdB family regulatory protein
VPIFKYRCQSCGLQFGSMQPAGAAKDALACKRCGESADRQLSAASFKFAHRPGAPGPQNTGASSVDHDVDVVIGRAAEQNLREYQRRQDHKRRVIAANDTTGDHLSRLDDGEYFVMTEQQRVAAKKARLQNQEAMQRISEWRAERRKAGSSEAAPPGSGR